MYDIPVAVTESKSAAAWTILMCLRYLQNINIKSVFNLLFLGSANNSCPYTSLLLCFV